MAERVYTLLDLFCGGGGCGMGYHRAGFKVTGVDNTPQPYYPFDFIKADAIEYLCNHWHLYDAIHLSPPCQEWVKLTNQHKINGKKYVDLITPIHRILPWIDTPTIIENGLGAPIRSDIILSGHMFGLKVLRKRKFELWNWFTLQPGIPKPKGSVNSREFIGVYGNRSWNNNKKETKGAPEWAKSTITETWQYAMGMDWTPDYKSISQAVPPAYTQYIGENLMQYLINRS